MAVILQYIGNLHSHFPEEVAIGMFRDMPVFMGGSHVLWIVPTQPLS